MCKAKKENKKKYKKPVLTTIDLAADEVLVNSCKTSTGGGQLGTCFDSGFSPCFGEGS